jgi:hypothetical protein
MLTGEQWHEGFRFAFDAISDALMNQLPPKFRFQRQDPL